MDRLEDLTPEKRKELEETLEQHLYSREWCYMNNIDYVNPDFSKARNIIYESYFSDKKK